MTNREKKIVLIGVPLMVAAIVGTWYVKQKGSEPGTESFSSAPPGVTKPFGRPPSPIGSSSGPLVSSAGPHGSMPSGVPAPPSVQSGVPATGVFSDARPGNATVSPPSSPGLPAPVSPLSIPSARRETVQSLPSGFQPVGADVLNPAPPVATAPVFQMIDPLAKQNANIRRMRRAVKELELQKQVVGLEAEVAKADDEKRKVTRAGQQAESEQTPLPEVVMVYSGTMKTAVVRYPGTTAVFIWQEGMQYDGFEVKSILPQGVRVLEVSKKVEHFLPIEPIEEAKVKKP